MLKLDKFFSYTIIYKFIKCFFYTLFDKNDLTIKDSSFRFASFGMTPLVGGAGEGILPSFLVWA